MLRLVDVKKDYAVAGESVHALKGVSVNFRKNEFVSILGPSGCGKTTLLNIIGGLDNYTSGDLLIAGKSTKEYADRDWDTYRNHSIGFIFQSYHLIPHQTILQNVELALMIAGVSKKERRERAISALEKVGLKGKLNNKPNQLSGGQAQRVAIARALINDPEIVLADEPTGALDSVTSVQIMELLKEIAQDRLVIMVTHNPELAEQYSTRIVRLLDGELIGDSMPYSVEEEEAERAAKAENTVKETAEPEVPAEKEEEKPIKGKKKHSSMSIGMAMGLSLKNLLSKRGRTAMVSVAGSIGIIGVSMVLAISAGVQGYINSMENDMLSGYPVSITQTAYDYSSLMELSQPAEKVDLAELAKNKKVYVNSLLKTLGTYTDMLKTNNISSTYVEYLSQMDESLVNLVQYGYAFKISNNLYTDFTVSDNLADHTEGGDVTGLTNEYNMSITAIRAMYTNVLGKVQDYSSLASTVSSVSTFAEMPSSFDYVMSQYDVVAVDKDGKAVTEGYTTEELEKLFNAKETIIMVVSDYSISDLTLAQYGYFTEDEFLNYAYKGISDEEVTLVGDDGFEYGKFIGDTAKKFTYYPNDCVYTNSAYVPSPQYSDDDIKGLFAKFGDSTGELAQLIIDTRKKSGDDGLRNIYNSTLKDMLTNAGLTMTEAEFVEMFTLPTDVVDGYLANAYSTEYTYDGGTPLDTSDDITLKAFSEKSGYDKRVEMGVKIILQKKESVSYGCLSSGFYYTKALTDYILDIEKDSEIVKHINSYGGLDGVPMYVDFYYVSDTERKYYTVETVQAAIETDSGNSLTSMISSMMGGTSSSNKLTAAFFGGSDIPTAIYFYPTDFEAKNKICDYLDAWNKVCTTEGASLTYVNSAGETVTLTHGEESGAGYLTEKDKITYTDTVGLIINMINMMIQIITIALVAFTALSLVVSTVMIGIITYVSVVERIKEIGILRAVGARKKDIKRLFNSETFIIGLTAGLFGILITYVLSLIINVIVNSIAGFWGIAALPVWQAVVMVVISVALTLISGLIPASAAAKKDPVVALRTE